MGMMMIFFVVCLALILGTGEAPEGPSGFAFLFRWQRDLDRTSIVFKMLHATMAFTIASSLHLAQCTSRARDVQKKRA